MAINTALANQQADQLRSYEKQLTQAKNNLREYQSNISDNWQSEETGYISQALDNVILEINNVLNELTPLSNDIRTVAGQIHNEEEAAIALARKQVEIQQLYAELDVAKNTAEDFKRKLEKMMNDANKNLLGSTLVKKNTSEMQVAHNNAVLRVSELQKKLNQLLR